MCCGSPHRAVVWGDHAVPGIKRIAGSVYPFTILNGPHGYTIQFLGTTEREALTKEYEGMLARLCKIKEDDVCQHRKALDR